MGLRNFGFLFLTAICFCGTTLSHEERFGSYSRNSEALAREPIGIYSGSYLDDLLLLVQLRADSSFSSGQMNLIAESFRILIDRALAPHVLDCTFSSAEQGTPNSRQDFEFDLFSALGPTMIGGMPVPSFFFVSSYVQDPLETGKGIQNLYYERKNPMPGYDHHHRFYVALNSDYLDSPDKFAAGKNPDFWAGVLAHQMLHNLGFEHTNPSAGSFIRQYEKCVRSDGMK